MSRLALAGLVLCLTAPAEAQTITPRVWPRPVYPQIAQAARVQGDVEVAVHVRPDGTVAAAEAVNGAPLLQQAAVDAAKPARFDCGGCTAPSTPYSLYVTFRLPGDPRRLAQPPLIVSPTQGWVTVDAPYVKPWIHVHYVWLSVHGPRCLYLWRCEREWGGKRDWYDRVRAPRCLGLWKCGWSKTPRAEGPTVGGAIP